MLEAIRIDAPACFTDAYFPQVRIFGRDAADITPHAADEVCDLGLGKPGKGAADVAPSISRPRKGPIRRASAPPTAEAQSSGTSLNTPSKNAAPQASRRLVSRGATTEKLGRVRAIAVADIITGVISPASSAGSGPAGSRHPHYVYCRRDQTRAPCRGKVQLFGFCSRRPGGDPVSRMPHYRAGS